MKRRGILIIVLEVLRYTPPNLDKWPNKNHIVYYMFTYKTCVIYELVVNKFSCHFTFPYTIPNFNQYNTWKQFLVIINLHTIEKCMQKNSYIQYYHTLPR